MAKKNFSYKEAMDKIEAIVHKIEYEEPDIDELSSLIRTASDLISECKIKLKATEQDLNNVLSQIEEK